MVMMIEEFGPRVASVWNHLRTTTRSLVERAWKSSGGGSVMQIPQPTPYDPRADHELSQLLAALDEHTIEAGLPPGDASREARRLADACANVLTQQTQSAEVFAQLIRRAHQRNDYARIDALAVKDGEKVVAAISLDPRGVGDIRSQAPPKKKPGSDPDELAPPVHAVAVSSDGYALRFSLESFAEPSTRSGRRYARPAEGGEIVNVSRLTGGEVLIAATAEGRGILCMADEVNYLSGPGKGVILIKLRDEDRVLGAIASSGDRDLLTVETTRGAEQTISTAKYEVTGRGGKGRELLQRGQFTRVLWPTPEAPPPLSGSS